MAQTVASMEAVLELNKTGFERNLRDADKSLTGFGSTLQGIISVAGGNLLAGAISGVGRAIAGGFGKFNEAVRESINLAGQQQDVEKQLAERIKSTGGAAGLTADEIKNMASQYQGLTTFGDEAVISAQNLLLTFKNISGPTFSEATGAILDMSVAMGQDLKSSTIQLGKALNDPITGITALSRVGVQFTETQKSMIATMMESGDLMGAQGIILEELTSQFGGAASAAADTFTGRMQQLSNIWGDFKEQLGDLVLPLLKSFAESVIPLVTRAIEFFKNNMKDKLLFVFGSLNYTLKYVIIPALKDFGAWFATTGMILFDAFIKVINYTVLPMLHNLAKWFVDTGKQALDWIGILVQVMQQNGLQAGVDFILKTLGMGWTNIKATLSNWASKFWDWVTGGKGVLDRAPEALDKILTKTNEWIDTVRPKLVTLGEKIGTILAEGIQHILDNKETIGNLVVSGIKTISNAVVAAQSQLNQIGEALAEGVMVGFARYFGINLENQYAKAIAKGVFEGLNPAAGLSSALNRYQQTTSNISINQTNNFQNGGGNNLAYNQLQGLAN